MSDFKPMLAADCDGDVSKLRFPLLASPKIDGIRCVVRDGKALTRSLKSIPNKALREWLESKAMFESLDGELVIEGGTFQDTTSAVMSHDGDSSQVTFHVFDVIEHPYHFAERLVTVNAQLENARDVRAQSVPHTFVHDENELADFEAWCLAQGYEGVMLRDPAGKYKHGRSTLKEGGLVKLKRFADAEAVIIGFEERMHNGNEAFKDELGRTKRSSAQAGKVGRGDLGAFVLQHASHNRCSLLDGGCGGKGWHIGEVHPAELCGKCSGSGLRLEGPVFTCGSGLTDAQRGEFWTKNYAGSGGLIGKFCKYKHLPHGAKDAPRHPVFLGIRAPEDM